MIGGMILPDFLRWISKFSVPAQKGAYLSALKPSAFLSGFFQSALFMEKRFPCLSIASGKNRESLKKRIFTKAERHNLFMNILERLDKKKTKACVLYRHRLK